MSQHSDPDAKPAKAYSCVRCFERKIRCDKEHPCSVCIRSRAECVPRVPVAPRRRPRYMTEKAVLTRLKRYEGLLRDNNIDFEPSPVNVSTVESTPQADDDDLYKASLSASNTAAVYRNMPSTGFPEARLIVDRGRSRFIANRLWAQVSEELPHSRHVIHESESEYETDSHFDDSIDLVLGATPSSSPKSMLHPSPDHLIRLWQIFLTNVDPLLKIVHRPTLQRSIEECIKDIDHIPRSLEALLFAIYDAAILSMRDGECQATFGESRRTLLSRYRLGTQRALTRAQFMASSELTVLQAFVIHLLVIRREADSRTLWALSGVAYRIAQGLGVHRDGTDLGLPPFETEMRRRLWWQINLLEFRAADLNGLGTTPGPDLWSTRPPLNVNDEEIWPGMKEAPEEHLHPTEMIACLVRYEVGNFWKKKFDQGTNSLSKYTSVLQHLLATNMKEKNEIVDEFEANMEEKFLKHCDTASPLQMMALIIGRMICKSKRLVAHHPRRYDNRKDIPDSELDLLWSTSVAIIQTYNSAYTLHALQKFHWYGNSEFPWQALILMVEELANRPFGVGKDDAWSNIEAVFRSHPHIISDNKKPLHIAIASMCIKAWQAREKGQLEDPQGSSWLETPMFIIQIHKQREEERSKRERGSPMIGTSQTGHMPFRAPLKATKTSSETDLQFQPGNLVDSGFSDSMMEEIDMDWDNWDALLDDIGIAPTLLSTNHSR